MSYNYAFFAFTETGDRHFPLDHTEVSDADFSHDLPWPQFKAWLLEGGGKINPQDEDSVEMRYPDRGSIVFRGSSECIGLETHAPWNEVVDAFSALKTLTAKAVLFNPQSGTFHDETSFGAQKRCGSR